MNFPNVIFSPSGNTNSRVGKIIFISHTKNYTTYIPDLEKSMIARVKIREIIFRCNGDVFNPPVMFSVMKIASFEYL